MKSLLFSVSLLISVSITGQDYKPLVIEGNSWSVVNWSWGWAWTYFYFLDGDTIINDTPYTKVYITEDSTFQNDVSFHGGIREDTVNKEVFFYYNSYMGEIMLYKFGMNIGDTAIVSSMACENIHMIVSDIDMIIDLNGIERRRMLMENWYDWYDEYWIEGIGSTLGLLTAGNFSCIADWNQEHLCFSQNQNLVYMNPLYTKCQIIEVGIKDNCKKEDLISIFPNPVTETSTIELPPGIKIKSIKMYDSFGRVIEVFSEPNRNIQKESYKSGIYILRVESDKGIHTAKFLIN